MKLKVINRSEEECTRSRRNDVTKVHRNLGPEMHPFDKQVEYTRALTAAKMDRMFAKPFIASFMHDDGVNCMARNPKALNSLLSGSADGDVRIWDVAGRRCLRKLVGHTAAVRGLAVTPCGKFAISASTDCTVRMWEVPPAPIMGGQVQEDSSPTMIFEGKNAFLGVDHHRTRNQFATSGADVQLWDHNRVEAVSAFAWGPDTVTSVRFNPAETDLFAATSSDRGVVLYDIRSSTPVRKVVMMKKSNAICWNPMEPLNFTVANDDSCLYSYDMRNLSVSTCVHKDFVSAVMSVDYSPTGREFVAGSYDRTLRIFRASGGHSREVYHTKRMQRVFASLFSGDATFVYSGSDDMNVRVWKADASEHLGTLLPREREKAQYTKALIEKHKHMPEIKSITRHRHLPKSIYKAKKLRRTMEDAEQRRQRNKIQHSAPGSVDVKPARKKKIIREME
jgi:WD repeat and SOF domain-containing protein 1